MSAASKTHIGFVASNPGWGGSEELWGRTALALANEGHRVSVLKRGGRVADERLVDLRKTGTRIRDLLRIPLVPRPITDRIIHQVPKFGRFVEGARLMTCLGRPDLAVLTQGANIDGRFLGELIRRRKRRYVIIAHKASEMDWPYNDSFEGLRSVYRDAARCFFVSEHNRRLTEEQLGMPLAHAEIVRNPFLVPWESSLSWPSQEHGLRVACVGRLNPREKGQDLLLRVLAMPKWRGRRISVSFFGAGVHSATLAAMAAHLQLENVSFAGVANGPAAIWKAHHALVLPSRAEGLPIVLVEAMLSGRVPIVTATAGNGELVRDSINGYLAAAPTEAALDDAMERAWQSRATWQQIGDRASKDARAAIPPDPAGVFAERLVDVARWAAG